MCYANLESVWTDKNKYFYFIDNIYYLQYPKLKTKRLKSTYYSFERIKLREFWAKPRQDNVSEWMCMCEYDSVCDCMCVPVG